MTPPTLDRPASPLDRPMPWADQPFFEQTCTLFRCVRDHDFDTLADLCDDDFGIVDLDPNGESVDIRTRAEWEAWFHHLFDQLGAMQATTDTEIQDYQALQASEMGYSVVRFCQLLRVGGQTHRFNCIVTIIWKYIEDRWKESRWHVSLLGREA